MSNEYKDWLFDRVQDMALAYGLVDKVTKVEPEDPIWGQPHHIEGLLNGEHIRYYINYDTERDWLYSHEEKRGF